MIASTEVLVGSPTPDRKALEVTWLQRLKDAKLRLDFARNYLKDVVQDFPMKEISNSDGHFAYQQAIRAENLALQDYNRVRRIYGGLTMNGIVPDEFVYLKARAANAGGAEGESE